jgi:hypothetical protein
MSHTTAGPAPTTNGGETYKDRIPHPLTTHRRVVQVHRVIDDRENALFTTVVCNDGSVWGMVNAGPWERLPDVPQDGEKGQLERLAAVAPSPEVSGEMQGSPPAPVAPAPIPLGAVVEVDAFRFERKAGAWTNGVVWFRDLMDNEAKLITALYHARHPVATRETVERITRSAHAVWHSRNGWTWDRDGEEIRSRWRDEVRHILSAAGFTIEEGA